MSLAAHAAMLFAPLAWFVLIPPDRQAGACSRNSLQACPSDTRATWQTGAVPADIWSGCCLPGYWRSTSRCADVSEKANPPEHFRDALLITR